MKQLILILSVLILFSACKLTKEERRMNRATKKLEKLVSKYPELERTDTVRYPVEVVTDRIQFDTILKITPDTVLIERDNLKVKWLVRNDTIWFDAMCDTIVVRDTVQVVTDRIAPVKYKPSQKGDKVPWWVWLVMGLMGLAILGLVFRG